MEFKTATDVKDFLAKSEAECLEMADGLGGAASLLDKISMTIDSFLVENKDKELDGELGETVKELALLVGFAKATEKTLVDISGGLDKLETSIESFSFK